MSYKKCVIKYSYFYAIKYSCHEAQRTWRYFLITTSTVIIINLILSLPDICTCTHLLAMAGQNIAAAIFCQSKKLFLFFIDNQPSLILFCFILYILAQIIIYSYMKSKNSEHQVCLYVICTLYVNGSLCCIYVLLNRCSYVEKKCNLKLTSLFIFCLVSSKCTGIVNICTCV